MRISKPGALVVAVAVTVFTIIPCLSWAGDDGAGIYKGKCVACHGADAAGKPGAKIPSLVSDDARKLSDADLGKKITDTAKHPTGVKSLTPDEVKALVSYIRSLQK
jgi:mono/diheme cytochrome c family protein